MNSKLHRRVWNNKNTDYLIKWWPHFGTHGLSEILGLKRSQVKAKVDKLKLKLLPKQERLCIQCKSQFQINRYAGLRCSTCHLARRRHLRQTNSKTTTQWIAELTNTARNRSATPSNLTTEYMVELWNNQKGRCYYSGLLLEEPKYGSERNIYRASIDRINPSKGYIKGNVVWCCWGCNAGKLNFTKQEYINLCQKVADHQQA